MSCYTKPYPELIECVCTNIITNFNEYFKNKYNPAQNCSSNAIIKSNQTIVVPRDAKIEGCTINISNSQTLQRESICADIPNMLRKMTDSDRTLAINTVVDQSTQDLAYLNRPDFVNELKTQLKKLIISQLSESSNSRCVQNISVNSNQEVVIGNMRCDKNSVLNISNDTMVKSFILCVVEPVISDLKNNLLLKDLFVPDKDCVFSESKISECDGSGYIAKISILKPKRGLGKCEFVEGQQVRRTCTLPSCAVGNWSDWSECLNKDGKGVKTRTRKFTQTGTGCDKFNTIEIENCDLSPAFRERPILQEEASNGIQKLLSINSRNLLIIVVILCILYLSLHLL